MLRSGLSFDQFLPEFDHNDGIWVGNKNVLSSDLGNVGQGHHLQKSLYLSYYMNDFYQSFIEMMTTWPTTKMSSADLENVGQGHR